MLTLSIPTVATSSYNCPTIWQFRKVTLHELFGREELFASIFDHWKHRLNDLMKAFKSWINASCPSLRFSKISLWRTWNNNCHGGTTNPESRGIKEGVCANFSSSRCVLQYWKAYALCGWLDAAMSSYHLWMVSWLLRKHSLALDLTAPLPCVSSTDIIISKREYIVVGIERLSSLFPQDDTQDSGRWRDEMGSKTIYGRWSGWKLERPLLEYQMHLSDGYHCSRYASYRSFQYGHTFDGLGNVLLQ